MKNLLLLQSHHLNTTYTVTKNTNESNNGKNLTFDYFEIAAESTAVVTAGEEHSSPAQRSASISLPYKLRYDVIKYRVRNKRRINFFTLSVDHLVSQ